MSKAYDEAKAGGDHEGLYLRYHNEGEVQIRKAIRSHLATIAKHERWIDAPESKVRPEATQAERELLRQATWPGQIRIFREEIEVLQGILQERKQ